MDLIRQVQAAVAFILAICGTKAPCVYLTTTVVYARSIVGNQSLILNEGVNSRVVLEWGPTGAQNWNNVNADDLKVVARTVFDLASKLSLKQVEGVQ